MVSITELSLKDFQNIWNQWLKSANEWLTKFKDSWDKAAKQLEQETDTVIKTTFTDKDGKIVSYVTTIKAPHGALKPYFPQVILWMIKKSIIHLIKTLLRMHWETKKN